MNIEPRETEELRDLLRQAINASDNCCQCLSYRCDDNFWQAVERLLPDLYEERTGE